MARDPRAVVVGAGHHGLVAAARLARAGFDVTVCEATPRAGGGVASGQDTLPGFVHDHCAGFFPLAAASPALGDLGAHGLEWIVPDIAMVHPFLDGTAIALHRDVEATAVSLERAAPGAGLAWQGLVTPLLAHGELVARTAFASFPPPPGPPARLALHLRGDAVELVRRMLGSVASLGRDLFEGAAAPTAWLCGSAAHSDLSPGATGSAAFGFALNWLGHHVGWPLPRGGAGALTAALVTALEEAGGHVRCGARVERVLACPGGRRVRGVRLAGGEELAADAVVVTLSAAPLLALLPDGALGHRLTRRLSHWRYGLGTFKVDWALSGPVPWSAPDARRAGVVHLGDTVEAYFRAAEESRRGLIPAAPPILVGQQSLHDRTRAPAGGETLYAYARVPSRYENDDEAVADRFEERIERFAPGFRRLVLARRVRSPAALERENASLVGGDLGGGSYELDQQLVFRPAPQLVRHRTRLRGLYVAGASVHPGGGVHGVSGAGAAAAVIADRSALRFWR